MKEREIIQGLITELEQLSKGEQCDHSVGICWCATFEALEYARAWIRQEGYLGPRSLCSCGHGGDGYPADHASLDGSAGHGHCEQADCPCPQFTFAGFTPEYADYRNTANEPLCSFEEHIQAIKFPGGAA